LLRTEESRVGSSRRRALTGNRWPDLRINDGYTRSITLSVKAGHVTVWHVRDLRGVLEREQAEIGVLISLDEPTGPDAG
jgi:hypothetical protein